MRILIFHGYLLSGTGSNVYTARLAAAMVRLGHEVHLLCQDRHPERQPFVDLAGDWDGGSLRLRTLSARSPVCTVYRPAIGPLLPVYVTDRYEGVQARSFEDCREAEVRRYIERNIAAVREVVELADPDLALANHLVMGPEILARALGGRVPYAVKVHGSALEYTVKRFPQRFLGHARAGIAPAAGILAGSRHTAESLWAALGRAWVQEHGIVERTRLGPPGVAVDQFVPRDGEQAAERLRALADRLASSPQLPPQPPPSPSRSPSPSPPQRPAAAASADGVDAFARDQARAGRVLGQIDPARDRVVAYVGKLIVSKGVDLLMAAWPLVLRAVPDALLVIVGFGALQEPLEEMARRLEAGEIDAVRAMAKAGRALEGGPRRPLSHLLAFLASLTGDRLEEYRIACRALAGRVLFTGRLEHEELADVLPLCEALVAPSTFPEAFGMVAAEAAACGVMPMLAAHSGLAEVAAALAEAVPAEVAPWLSFPVDDGAVAAIARRLTAWLHVDPELGRRARNGLVGTARETWSWEGVARGVIAAAEGRLQLLRPVPGASRECV